MIDVKVPHEQAERVRAEIVQRFGLDPTQIVEGSLVMTWDSDQASVEWRGRVSLTASEAAELFAAAMT